MSNTMKSVKVMGSVSAPATLRTSDKIQSIMARLERQALDGVRTAINKAGGANIEMKASSVMRNVLDGTVSLSASWFDGRKRVAAKADLQVAGGELVLDLKAFLASAAEVKHDSPVAAAKTYAVDAAKLRAKRVGGLVLISHDHLPEWGLRITMDDLKASREMVEARIAASIQGFCASQFNRNADIQGGVKMPVVASEMPTQVPAQEAAKATEHATLQTEQQTLTASMPSSQDTGAKASPADGDSRQWEAEASLKASLTRAASDAAMHFVRTKLAGGNPSVKVVDLTGVVTGSKIMGSAVVAVEFYGNRSREQVTLDIPFDERGRVVASKVDRTKADIAAAEELRSKLAVASEAEAKEIFSKFVAEEIAKQERMKALGINASSDMGYGSNWIKRGPADRIPIPKNALPEELSVIGKKILVGGMVYEIQPTDFNAPSIERSAHWMLELRPEIPASKADYAFNSSGLGQALSTVGL